MRVNSNAAVLVIVIGLVGMAADASAADGPKNEKSIDVKTPDSAKKPDSTKTPDKQPIKQADDGTVLLHAKDVTIHGTTVRYEPQPNKNTIGYWTKVEDSVSWEFKLTQSGSFDVEILQGCGNGSGGSEVEFSVGDQILKVTVKETGGFQEFVAREIGKLKFEKAGRYKLIVQPKTKPGKAVMDLRSVTLKPIEK